MAEGHLTPQEAAELALLEQFFQVCPYSFPPLKCQVMLVCVVLLLQTRRWGRVEWAHDVDQQDMTSRLAAAKVVHSLV